MPNKRPKGRQAEQRYAKRVRSLQSRLKKVTKDSGRTPWKQFFASGLGATIVTGIPKTSIHSIVYNYGKKLGKRFQCSYEEQDEGGILVRIESVKGR